MPDASPPFLSVAVAAMRRLFARRRMANAYRPGDMPGLILP